MPNILRLRYFWPLSLRRDTYFCTCFGRNCRFWAWVSRSNDSGLLAVYVLTAKAAAITETINFNRLLFVGFFVNQAHRCCHEVLALQLQSVLYRWHNQGIQSPRKQSPSDSSNPNNSLGKFIKSLRVRQLATPCSFHSTFNCSNYSPEIWMGSCRRAKRFGLDFLSNELASFPGVRLHGTLSQNHFLLSIPHHSRGKLAEFCRAQVH
jgi:hypothetical protein